MLKVSKNNPLYRLALYWDKHPCVVPANICPFLRHAVYGVFKGIFMAVLVLIVITVVDFSLVSVVWTTCLTVFGSFGFVGDGSFYLFFGVTIYIIAFAALILLSGKLIIDAINNWGQRRAEKYADRSPGVIAEYIKARHSKICVPIEFN